MLRSVASTLREVGVGVGWGDCGCRNHGFSTLPVFVRLPVSLFPNVTPSHSNTHTHTHAHARTDTSTHTCSLARSLTHSHLPSYSHARARAHTHTHTRTQYRLSLSACVLPGTPSTFLELGLKPFHTWVFNAQSDQAGCTRDLLSRHSHSGNSVSNLVSRFGLAVRR